MQANINHTGKPEIAWDNCRMNITFKDYDFSRVLVSMDEYDARQLQRLLKEAIDEL